MRDLIDIMDLSTEEIQELIVLAGDIIADPEQYQEVCRHKKLATLFFEPSTRTRLSFEAAMLDLGGSVLGFSEAASSSASKGESVGDTVAVVSGYADIIAMRHPKEGAPLVASMRADVPIINAGDGSHHHPTQTLTDLLTIHREKGRLDHMTIGLCGDLKFGRTVHSLIAAMSRYEGVEFVLISPEELKLPSYVKDTYIKSKGIPYTQTTDLQSVMSRLDVLYMTRVQKERFFNEEDYLRLRDSYILTPGKLKDAKEDLTILHPLPRVNEISTAVDADPRAAYFRQARNGKFIRMALIMKLLEGAFSCHTRSAAQEALMGVPTQAAGDELPDWVTDRFRCGAPGCITAEERGIRHIFHLTDREKREYRCIYCDTKANPQAGTKAP